jgi:hypothetical protein
VEVFKRGRGCLRIGKEVNEWLDVMSATTIISEGVVYLAGRRKWARDRFHVFERAVSYGKELEPGRVADKNFVWLHEWQIENINNNHLLPLDLEAYRQLLSSCTEIGSSAIRVLIMPPGRARMEGRALSGARSRHARTSAV